MSKSILLVDDSPTIGRILKMALQNEPYEVRSVLNFDDAMREFEKQVPDFFLVDLSLPEKDGYELTKIVKSNPKWKNVLVILLSQSFDPIDEQKVQASSADGVIEKPFDPAELRATLRSISERPPKFPKGTHVVGALSGSPIDIEATKINPEPDLLATENTKSSNDILADLIDKSESPRSSPSEPPKKPTADTKTNTLNEFVLDFSVEAEAKTAMIDMTAVSEGDFNLTKTPDRPPGPPPGKGPKAKSHAHPSESSESIGPNAVALMAFFAAEVESVREEKEKSKLLEVPVQAQAAMATSTAQEPDLENWSSANRTEDSSSTSATTAKTDRGAFDTGKSTFRFSTDYLARITKAFTGAADESVPTKHHVNEPERMERPVIETYAPPAPVSRSATASALQTPPGKVERTNIDLARPNYDEGFFDPTSGSVDHDSGSSFARGESHGAGAIAAPEISRELLEEIVRKEVNIRIQEVLEKIAWEVIPELAENLIRKELDRVLQELEK